MIDCDVHNELPSWRTLLDYVDDYWKETMTQGGFQGPTAGLSLPGDPLPVSLSDVRTQVLERDCVEGAVLTCTYEAESVFNPYAAATMTSAVNDWQIDTWLEPEPRVRGSVVVPSSVPAFAAKEIDRVGGHPGFVQVLLPARSATPYGHPNYLPLFEAADRNGLNVCIHAGGLTGMPPTGTGWPSYYAEQVVAMAGSFQAQLTNLVLEGTLERFGSIRLILAESGFAWLPGFLWRLDKEWKGLRRETPWVTRPPSEIVAEHVVVTLQPFDCPADRFESIKARLPGEMLMFASDYPHRHPEIPVVVDHATLDATARKVYRWS